MARHEVPVSSVQQVGPENETISELSSSLQVSSDGGFSHAAKDWSANFDARPSPQLLVSVIHRSKELIQQIDHIFDHGCRNTFSRV
ncbi:hypothetical protein PENSUB_2064 [Penicillium subrubescens]|jgi:hypothetical protein|uniref:Uncharacterized protein n=1 Tax=Penicillium subrubescens TaxID=1316194 RepID=A0A1Q5UIK7_9EURO|nr:hypothetical protein PENSUB_2064 [Penicillium subrubescens]